jgi:hypothetical protein
MFTYIPSDTTSSDNGGTIIISSPGHRYYREQHLGPFNILWFGGSPNGTTDNATALNHALGVLPSGGGEIFFPPGKYMFSGTITYNLQAGPFSVSFVGSGADASILYWPNSSAMIVNAYNASHSIHFRDLSVTTGSTAYKGIILTNSTLLGRFAQSDFYRVTFRGDFSGANNYGWTTALQIIGLSNISYDTVLFYGASSGTGLDITGNSSISPYYSIVHNLSKCGFFDLATGFIYGTYLQGVTLNQCNFTNGTTGISIPSGAVGATQITISDSQFNVTGNQILIQAPIAGIFVSGNLIYVPTSNTGILITSSGTVNQSSFVGNLFAGISATGSTGIDVLGSSQGSIVTGNTFDDLAVGVNLAAASGWNVQANVYANVTIKVANGGGGNSVGIATE